MSDEIFGMLDLDIISKLAAIVKDNDLGEITIVDGDNEITVKGKKCNPPPIMPPMMPQMPAPTAVSVAVAPVAEAKVEAIKGTVVKSPIVGTFYAAASPENPPFVTIGQKVKKGDVLMIIESMKLMNEVPCEYDGVITDILVENGSAVEFDQALMIIE